MYICHLTLFILGKLRLSGCFGAGMPHGRYVLRMLYFTNNVFYVIMPTVDLACTHVIHLIYIFIHHHTVCHCRLIALVLMLFVMPFTPTLNKFLSYLILSYLLERTWGLLAQ